jgi:hypothetical protein
MERSPPYLTVKISRRLYLRVPYEAITGATVTVAGSGVGSWRLEWSWELVPLAMDAAALEKLILDLHEIEAVMLGSFVLKSDITSPIYIDLLCGVSYTALPIAVVLSVNPPQLHRVSCSLRRPRTWIGVECGRSCSTHEPSEPGLISSAGKQDPTCLDLFRTERPKSIAFHFRNATSYRFIFRQIHLPY